mgnify:CR=1 FL=1
MSRGNEQLRKELEARFQPPIDVLLDPSLLTARTSLGRLDDSVLFKSQKQATLGQTPSVPTLGEIHVPGAFVDAIENNGQSVGGGTTVWEFYRGQADGAPSEKVVRLIEENSVKRFRSDGANILDIDNGRSEQLRRILAEELAFISSGGIVLSRSSATFSQLRDAGAPTVDVGKATLDTRVLEKLTEIGYRDPARVVVFGVGSAPSTIDALVGSVIDSPSDVLLYRIGD